jgi:hypothetical protein
VRAPPDAPCPKQRARQLSPPSHSSTPLAGYFTRVRALERILGSFLALTASGQANVISLGAGLDSLPFRTLAAEEARHIRCVVWLPLSLHVSYSFMPDPPGPAVGTESRCGGP